MTAQRPAAGRGYTCGPAGRRVNAYVLCVALLICLFASPALPSDADSTIIRGETRTKSFDDVVFELEFAITQRNFRISARNDIAGGLRARGIEDIPAAMIVHFCNLSLAHEALEIDPLLLTYMPCRVAVYDHRDRVVVSTLRLPEDTDDPRANAFARKMNGILRRIVNFAVN